MRALVVSNPNSTSITDSLYREVVMALRTVPGLSLKAVFTAYKGHATELATGLTTAEFDLIVCLGGDGTVNEVVNGLLATRNPSDLADTSNLPAVAIIPTGSANVLAGSLHIPRNPRDAAWHIAKLLKRDQKMLISAGFTANRWFVVNAGVGIDADVIATMDKLRSSGTKASALRYLPEVFDAWRRIQKQPPQITAVVDDKVVGEGLPVAIVSNTNPWTFLGDLPVVTNPQTQLHTGLGFFGVKSLSGISGIVAAANLGGALIALRRPFRTAEREVRIDDAQRVRLSSPVPLKFQLDGEYIDERSVLDIEVLENAVCFVAKPRQHHERLASRILREEPLGYRLVEMLNSRVIARIHSLFARHP